MVIELEIEQAHISFSAALEVKSHRNTGDARYDLATQRGISIPEAWH